MGCSGEAKAVLALCVLVTNLTDEYHGVVGQRFQADGLLDMKWTARMNQLYAQKTQAERSLLIAARKYTENVNTEIKEDKV